MVFNGVFNVYYFDDLDLGSFPLGYHFVKGHDPNITELDFERSWASKIDARVLGLLT